MTAPGAGSGEFVRGVVAMTFGSIAAPLLATLATPILSRLYPVEAFGVLAVFSSIVAIAGAIATMRYEQGVVLPERSEDAAALVAVAVCVSGAVGLLLLIAAVVFGPPIARALEVPGIDQVLWLVAPVVAAFGVQQAHSYWATRRGQYWQLASARTSQSLVGLALQLAGGVWLSTAWLVWGFAAGVIAGAVGLAGWLLWRDGALLRSGWARERMRVVAHRYSELPRYALQTSLLNALSSAMLPLLVAATFGLAAAGIVSVVDRVTRPLILVAGSIWQVGHSQLPKLDRDAQRALVERIHRAGSLLLAFPLATIAAFSHLAPAVFGEQWHGMGDYVLPLAVMLYFNCLNNMTSYFAVFERYRAQVVANVLLVAVRLTALLLGARLFDALGAIWAYALVSAVFYLAVNTYWGVVLGRSRSFLLNVGYSLGMAGALIGTARLAAGYDATAGWIAFGASAAIYAALIPRVAGFSLLSLLASKPRTGRVDDASPR